MPVVLVAAQDTGGANALSPVITALGQHPDVQLRVVATGRAVDVFSREGKDHQKIDSDKWPQHRFNDLAAKILSDNIPDILLTGTSWGPSLEKALAESSRARGIPSLAVLDMWSYYRERFEKPPANDLSYLPTKVAVMDQHAFDEAVQAGLPPGSLVITGQPYLETIGQRVQDPQRKQAALDLRRGWLAEAGATDDASVVIFISEPIERDMGPSTKFYRGYTEIDALEGLVGAALALEKTTGQSSIVVLKLHPEQAMSTFNFGPLAASMIIPSAGGVDPWTPVIASDAVVGMTSMLLMEAVIAGKPTVSFQPGSTDPTTFVGSRLALLDDVSSSEELEAWLTRSRNPNNSTSISVGQPLELAHQGAAERVAGALLEMLDSNSHGNRKSQAQQDSTGQGASL